LICTVVITFLSMPRYACVPVTLMITVDPSGTLTLIVEALSSADAGTVITFVAGSVPVIVSAEACVVYVPFAGSAARVVERVSADACPAAKSTGGRACDGGTLRVPP
jgi:hypothetical protein